MTAFHPDYKMTDRGATPVETLAAGLRDRRRRGPAFVYAGNIPGRVGPWENTRCPGCGATLIRRSGFRVLENRLSGGRCPRCGTGLAGRWD